MYPIEVAKEILLAIVCYINSNVVDLFNGWKDNPSKWKNKLFVPPQEYSLEGGWELREEDKRLDLFYKDCYVI